MVRVAVNQYNQQYFSFFHRVTKMVTKKVTSMPTAKRALTFGNSWPNYSMNESAF